MKKFELSYFLNSNFQNFRKFQKLRNLHGVPPLILNEELNEITQNYSNILTKEKWLEHINRKVRELKEKKANG